MLILEDVVLKCLKKRSVIQVVSKKRCFDEAVINCYFYFWIEILSIYYMNSITIMIFSLYA